MFVILMAYNCKECILVFQPFFEPNVNRIDALFLWSEQNNYKI